MPSFYIVLEQQITDAGTFVNGNFLSRNKDQLDKLTAPLGVPCLSDFFSISPEEVASIAESAVDTSKIKEQWFSAEDGLRTIRALQNNLAASGIE